MKYIDIQSITELDPSLSDGHHISIELDLPMTVVLKGQEDALKSDEQMHLKVLVLGDEQEPGNIRFEITSMEDIFFHYVANVNEEGFKQIQAEQQLNIEYNDFYNIIQKVLE